MPHMPRLFGRRILAAAACLAGVLSLVNAPSATAASVISYPAFAYTPPLPHAPSSCAVSVSHFLGDRRNDTAAFTAAMKYAVATHPNCYPAGPSGAPQAVVAVPPGIYRIAGLYFPSNLRMEVDAGAILQEPANRPAVQQSSGVSMIVWDNRVIGMPAVQNVSLVGVGWSYGAYKAYIAAKNGALLRPFYVAHDFIMDLNPAWTGSTNYNPGITMMNVQHFLVQNVISIQNPTNQRAGKVTAWPTSARAVIEMHARKDSPISGGSLLEPKYGRVVNQVNIGSPRGYGPNQVNGAYYVVFENIFSRGGTALRLETDGSMNGQGIITRGAMVDHLYGRNIVGVYCNRAVSLSPHAQHNGYVNVLDVWAYSCNQAVIAAVDNNIPSYRRGYFRSAYVSAVHVVSGSYAQLDSTIDLWQVGRSYMPAYVAPGVTWQPHISVVDKYGLFTRP